MGRVVSTHLWPSSQDHNLVCHGNHHPLGISSRVLLKHDGEFLLSRFRVTDAGQDIRAGAMKIIHSSIKGDIMDTSIGQAVTTARGVASLNAVLYPALLIGLTVCTFLAGDLATRPALTQPLTLRAWVEGGS